MKKFLLAAAGAAALALAAAPASAAIFIGIATTPPGGAPVTVAGPGPDLLPFTTFSGLVGGGWGVQVSATGGLLPTVLASNTIDIQAAGAGTLDVFVTRTDLTGPIPAVFASAFTSQLLDLGWSVTMTTLLDIGNNLYTGMQLGSASFTNSGVAPFGLGTATAYGSVAAGAAGPYSVTERYTVTATGVGSAQSTSVLQTAIPEPTTWALMILGFGSAGAMLRSRRRAVAAAA